MQPNIIQSRKYFSIKSENKSFSDTFKIVSMKRKGCVMQLTRVFSGNILKNCFNFEKCTSETSPCVCIRACKRVRRFESLLLSCITLSHICQNDANIFSETLTNMFLLRSSSVHQFDILYTYFIIRRVIILELIKLMTHSEAHHTNYSLLKRKTLLCGK